MRNGSSWSRRAVNCTASLSERRPSHRRCFARSLVRRPGSCQLTETRGNTETRTGLNIYMEIQFTQTDLSPHCAPAVRVMNEPRARPLPENSLSRDSTHLCPAGIDQQSLCCYPVNRGRVRRQRQEERQFSLMFQTAGVILVPGAFVAVSLNF